MGGPADSKPRLRKVRLWRVDGPDHLQPRLQGQMVRPQGERSPCAWHAKAPSERLVYRNPVRLTDSSPRLLPALNSQVDNPDYLGVWAPKKIANPNFFTDDSPHAMAPIGGAHRVPQLTRNDEAPAPGARVIRSRARHARCCCCHMLLPLPSVASIAAASCVFHDVRLLRALPAGLGIELWTMQDGILFDNILIANDASVASTLAAKTFVPRRAAEDVVKKASVREAELSGGDDSFLGKVKVTAKSAMYYAQDNPAIVGGSLCLGLLPIILFCCLGGVRSAKQATGLLECTFTRLGVLSLCVCLLACLCRLEKGGGGGGGAGCGCCSGGGGNLAQIPRIGSLPIACSLSSLIARSRTLLHVPPRVRRMKRRRRSRRRKSQRARRRQRAQRRRSAPPRARTELRSSSFRAVDVADAVGSREKARFGSPSCESKRKQCDDDARCGQPGWMKEGEGVRAMPFDGEMFQGLR